MKIDLNDPRLTAYALGELPTPDRQAFEVELAGDPVARQEVENIQRAAGVLKDKLEAEACPRLEPAQRDVIYDELEPAASRTGFRWWIDALAGAATLVILAGLLLPVLNMSRRPTQQLVVNTPPKIKPAPTTVQLEKEQFKALYGHEVKTSGNSGAGGSPNVLIVSNGGRLFAAGESTRGAATPTLEKAAATGDSQASSELGTALAENGSGAGNTITVNGGIVRSYITPQPAPLRDRALVTGAGSVWVSDGAGVAGGALTIGSVSSVGNGSLGEGIVVGSTAGLNTLNGGQITVGSAAKSTVNLGYIDGHANFPSDRRQAAGETDANGRLDQFRMNRDYAFQTGGFGSADLKSITPPGTESYPRLYDNPFYNVTDQPLSTFGLDVDTASYSNIRRFLLNNQLPPRDSVRIEEMLNYFTYDYPAPRGNEPFALYVEMGECPWNPAHQLALIGLKAKDVTARQQPPLNLVFLIDVSGSMSDANKLPLIKQAFHLLVPQLDERDRVAIVVYASNARVALPSTRGDQHRRILSVIDELTADGGTNGGEGIQNAYAQASDNFIKGGVNRVILCTDGDFNVGITDQDQLTRLIKQKAASGVFLNVFGFGMGNLKDSTMQKLADNGNGHYAYIDDIDEARKVLVDQARSTIITVAKDVKLQVEFNPAQVQAYRLIGYEKRQLAARDFNNDKKDAGEMGAGHTVTALYEIVPAGEAVGEPGVDPLKYQPAKNRPAVNGEWATVKLRYKQPDSDKSDLLTAALKNTGLRWRTASDDFQFAAAVAAFGMTLRDSPYKAESNLELAAELAEAGRGRDVKGYRSEFVELVKRAAQLGR